MNFVNLMMLQILRIIFNIAELIILAYTIDCFKIFD